MIDLEKLTEEQREGFHELQEDLMKHIIKEFSKVLPEEAKEKLRTDINALYEEYRKAGFITEEEKPKFDIDVENTDDELTYNIIFNPLNKSAAEMMKAYNSVQG